MRRECQEIIPGFLLGPFIVSKQLEKMKELGITHMCALCCGFVASLSLGIPELFYPC